MTSPQNWTESRLGELCTLHGGTAFSRSLQGRSNGSIPFIKQSDMSLSANSMYIHESNNWVDEADLLEVRASPLPSMSVVFGKIGEGLKRNRFRVLTRPTLIDNNMMGAVPNSKVDQRFFAIVMSQIDMGSLAEGSALPYLRAEDVGNVRVLLPPMGDQRAIASVLGAIDDKIEFNQRQQSTLLSICHAAFDVALMKGPDVMKVEDMVRFRNNERKPLSAMERSGMERRYPYYGATGIFDYVDGYLFDDMNILIGEDGSVVNDDGTPVAQMAWGKYWVNNHAHVLSGKAVSTELAFIALARSDVRPLITGAVQLKINMGNLKSLEVALPSVEVRGDVNREIQENFALWRAKSDESKMLVGLRDALLPELLSGRLRVKDAESMMENV